MLADDCLGVEVMLCGVDVSASDISNIELGGGCQVAWAVDLLWWILSLAVARMLAQVHTARRRRLGLAGSGVLAYATRGTKCKACWRWVATRRK